MKLICGICGKELIKTTLLPHLRTKHNKMQSQEYYDKYLKKEGEGFCLTCGKPTKYITLFKGYRIYCSNKCAQQSPEIKHKIKGIRLEKYDGKWNKDYKEKYTKTCQENYGSNSANTDEKVKKKKEKTRRDHNNGEWHTDYKEKYTKACQENYGLDSANEDKEVKRKKEETWLKNLGVKNPMHSVEVKQKIRENFLRKRLPVVLDLLQLKELELLHEYEYAHDCCKLLCKKCGKIFETPFYNILQGYGKCPSCYPRSASNGEVEIGQFLEEELKFEIETHNRKFIAPYELDIYIPSKKFAIEYNGIYYHSEKCGKDYKYHLNKLNLCTSQEITLIQIFEDEWAHNSEGVKARLAKLLKVSKAPKIYARKCIIKTIPLNDAVNFLKMYHLQGAGARAPVNLGAFFNDDLISVMTFSHGSPSKGIKITNDLIWELDRFCCNYNYNVLGIASKLLSHFKKNYNWQKIYSYADRRWSTGVLYETLGFTLTRTTHPNYWYVKGGTKRIHRYAMRKKEYEAKDIPEWALRLKEGYTRVWDCGNLRFELKK